MGRHRVSQLHKYFVFVKKGLKYLARFGVRATLARTVGYFRFRSVRDKYHNYFTVHRIENLRTVELEHNMRQFTYLPKISIVMPVYNVPVKWLHEAVQAVTSQIYPNWELCVHDDKSTDTDTVGYLRQLSLTSDKRIKVTFGNENAGISVATNQAIANATGEFVAFMDNDDVITVDALYEIVCVLQQSDYDFIYSDEDKLTINGIFTDPYYKPDWSPDLLLSGNYTSHLAVYRKSIGDKVGWLREGYEGSQDYDFVLRFTELTRAIYHIPKVLYHWRMIPGSTAEDPYAKPYAYVSGQRALSDAAERQGLLVKVTSLSPGHYRFERQLFIVPRVTVITRGTSIERLGVLRAHMRRFVTNIPYQLVALIENYAGNLGPQDSTKVYAYNENEVQVLNQAIQEASGDIVLILSPAIVELSEEPLLALLEHGVRSDVGGVTGCVTCRGRVVHAGLVLGAGALYDGVHRGESSYSFGYFGNLQDTRNCAAISADCIMFRKDIFTNIGGFDAPSRDGLLFDIDYSLRARKLGYYLVYTPHAQLKMEYTVDESLSEEGIGTLRRRWGHQIDVDPYYNPNLARETANYLPFYES